MFKKKKALKKSLLALTFIVTGCNSILPAPTKYEPPVNSTNISKIRLMGNPLYPSIDQKDSTGKFVGGFIVEHNRFLNLGFGTTVDIGLPKIQRNDYSGKYFETVIKADTETLVDYWKPNCRVSLKFMPKKDSVYEVRYSDTDKTGYCVLYIRAVVLDKTNSIYVEEIIK